MNTFQTTAGAWIRIGTLSAVYSSFVGMTCSAIYSEESRVTIAPHLGITIAEGERRRMLG